MGHKVSPTGLRVGVIKNWDSRWYSEDMYVKWVHDDINIRKALIKVLGDAVSTIEIEKTKSTIVIFIRTARVGVVLGQEGKNIPELIKLVRKTIKDRKIEVKINVVEVKNPDLDAQLVANTIASQIVNRASFRTVQKIAIKKALKAGAKGIKTSVSGRLGGVDMARREGYIEGTVPLATLRSDIDYGFAEALTTYGQIGVKVWICKGEILGKDLVSLSTSDEKSKFEKPRFDKPKFERRESNFRPNNNSKEAK
ncbi:30S ribosomal protein S3 [Spiroplasma syrphidicola EA-1]|uniref:Small ribosomal subunit protein uS3 n=1 Tax=Spiroplasma syrphidicola EA-1 TaxID=1276229 RepID=R4U353_9MOLU|nr:30S ribosomal protein S3 [Spiroplasma syrphidicola]AGM25817.1 30S ribosomal protein S3 [Spiroplasma syrphidicola EA-1]